jgi:UDP-3-O-[3-hydroxymyristoyl] glucosamine N-acyltransferase
MNRTAYCLADLTARFGGRVLGDAETRIVQIASLNNARSGHIVFFSNSRLRTQLEATRASAVILGEADAEATALPRIVCDNSYAYFAKVSALLNPPPQARPGIHPSAAIGEGARVDSTAHIGAHVTVGAGAVVGAGCVIMEGCSIGANTVIGSNARLYPRVVVYHDCVIGNNLIAHSGAVIGSDGFGMAMENGRWLKIPQIGRVVIGDDVEIGANTTIDRGALDDTVIEDDVKLDNLVQVAHNVRIGAHTAIAGCAGISGSVSIGKYCRIGGGVGIAGHLQINDNVEIAGFTLIAKSIREPGVYAGGYPFSKHSDWLRNAAHLRHLDELADRVKQLKQEIEEMKRKNP